MDRKDYLLAVLATSGDGSFTPVQIQKLLFLLDKEVPDRIGGPHFHFIPYDYGPFDSEVYDALEQLTSERFVDIDYTLGTRRRVYRLTGSGRERGTSVLDRLPPDLKGSIEALSAWVRSLSFEQLVAGIYQRYPEMKVRSVFRG